MSDPKERLERTGSGGSSDGDTQPDDTGATGTLGDTTHAANDKHPDDDNDRRRHLIRLVNRRGIAHHGG